MGIEKLEIIKMKKKCVLILCEMKWLARRDLRAKCVIAIATSVHKHLYPFYGVDSIYNSILCRSRLLEIPIEYVHSLEENLEEREKKKHQQSIAIHLMALVKRPKRHEYSHCDQNQRTTRNNDVFIYYLYFMLAFSWTVKFVSNNSDACNMK